MTTEVNRWDDIERMLLEFGQAMWITADELVHTVQWMTQHGYGFTIHTLHTRSDPRRYHIKRD